MLTHTFSVSRHDILSIDINLLIFNKKLTYFATMMYMYKVIRNTANDCTKCLILINLILASDHTRKYANSLST